MAYIIERNHRFYVVAYDGIDPLTRRERRRWHPAGRSRVDAEAIVAALEQEACAPLAPSIAPATLGQFLTEQWMPRRRTQLGQTTAHRYGWMIDNYVNPRLGDVQLRALRVEHIDGLYHDLLTRGSRTGGPLATKTVYDVHVIVRSSLTDAVRRRLVDTNVALAAQPSGPGPPAGASRRREATDSCWNPWARTTTIGDTGGMGPHECSHERTASPDELRVVASNRSTNSVGVGDTSHEIIVRLPRKHRSGFGT